MAKKQKLYVEASAITEPRMSGIGHSIVAMLKALAEDKAFTSQYEIVLLVSADMRKNLTRWNFPATTVKTRSIWLEKHVLQVLLKYGLLPPMDLTIGRGIYLFPNYKNWPLAFSKSVTFVYDVAFMIFPETIQPKNLKMLQRNMPKWVSRTNKIVTISETSKQEISKQLGVNKSKIDIAYCGVDTNEFSPQSKQVIELFQKEHQLPSDYLLFLSSIEPRKNISRLLEAYIALPEAMRTKHPLLLVGGGGWLNQDILARIEELQKAGYNIVRSQNYVEDQDLPALMSGAQMLVHPAIHEGFGLAPLQAMACGTPVAVSDIGAIKEVVGEAGSYFDPSSTEEITATIKGLLESQEKASKLAEKGLERAKEFSWQQTAQQLAETIKQL